MRVGIAGLDALYWPVAMANGLKGKGVELLGAATLGVSAETIHSALGLAPAEYAQKYGARLYETAEEMVARERLDTVILVSRHSKHAEWAERLAALGVNLFIPKTFTTTLGDAQRIVAAEKRYGVQIAVGPSARYLPPMMAVKEALERDLIGRPFSLRICHHHGTIDVFNRNDWYRDPAEGGPELSLGWYGIDLILHLMQDKASSVYAEYGNFTSPDSPFMDCGRMLLRMAGGGLASFDMYFCERVPYPSWQLEILGPKGVISIHRTEADPLKPVVAVDGPNGHQALPLPTETPGWEMFWVDDFLAGREPTITAEGALLITRISLAAREAAQSGRPARL